MTQTFKNPPQYRLAVADIYRDYADGHLTVKGAVFGIVAATCRFGDPVNLNVSEFLERTGIHPGSYARAVKTLIDEGRLDYPPNAVQTLRVPVIPGTRTPVFQAQTEERSQICSERSQICDRCQQICDRGQQICDRCQQICSDEALKLPSDVPFAVPSISLSNSVISLSEPEREESEIERQYTEWLTSKAHQLPTPPTLLEEWIAKNRDKKSNRKEFFSYKKSRDEAVIPQPAAPAIFEPENENENRLALLNHWWDDGYQERVKATIAAHPEWGLVVTDTGVEVST